MWKNSSVVLLYCFAELNLYGLSVALSKEK